ncbi:hypothetical protein [Amnibacterium endophyticum]|uniref:Alkaline shock response membrane anchor protein AmaP n=1 Tax=Amnibacterium endophyticum TaxID=2109337 RepID=A0ABW4LEY5_9MICO
MNSSNRGANRLLLIVTGLILLAAGAAALVMAGAPAVRSGFRSTAGDVTRSAPAWIADPAVGRVSWLTIAVGAVAVVLAVLLIAFVVRHGRGHTSRVVDAANGAEGRTLVDLGVPRALLDEELSDRDEFVATRISAYRVKGVPTLKVSVQCRRGVSPADATRIVTEALDGLDGLLGRSLPAMVQLSGGFRSRTAARARLT